MHNPTTRATAMHEAGHAVAAVRYGLLLSEVTIKRIEHEHGATLGHATTEESTDPDEEVVGLYCGLAAERLADPSASEEGGAWDDYEKADALLPSCSHTKAELEASAAEFVQRERAAVDALADALIERETISGDLAQIVVDAVDEGEDWRDVVAEYASRFPA